MKDFYDHYGANDSATGKKEMERILNDWTIGSWYIAGDYSEAEQEKHKQDFLNYLERGEKKNVGTN